MNRNKLFIIFVVVALISGILWGLDSVLISLAPSIVISSAVSVLTITILSTLVRDASSVICVSVYNISTKQFKSYIKSFPKKENIPMMIYSVLVAASMVMYFFSVKIGGAGLVGIVTSVYPIVCIILSRIFLNESLNFPKVIGSILCAISIILISIADMKQSFIAIILSFIVAVIWAGESVVGSKYMRNSRMSPSVALACRQSYSVIVEIICLIILGFNWSFINPNNSLILGVFGIAGSISYLLWYISIDKVGSGLSTLLNSTYNIFTIIFSILILKSSFSWTIILSLAMIIIGLIFALTVKERDGKLSNKTQVM